MTTNPTAIETLNQLRTRHGVLIDKKFLDGLTEAEAGELAEINAALDAADEEYYRSVKEFLAGELAQAAGEVSE